MSTAHDRRAPGTARIPFDAMVEVGGALGPSFEARAVNLSEEGMSLRTAYLPEVGQPMMCRFDAGEGMTVLAAGEVQWAHDEGEGGEFGLRFTNLDPASTVALQRVLGMAEQDAPGPGLDAQLEHGRKVRLHIEGLASPMRARIKGQLPEGVMAYTELGFAQMGRALDLEDAQSGQRRPAVIDRVEVAVDDASRVPQLVFSLRYEGAAAAPIVDDADAIDDGDAPPTKEELAGDAGDALVPGPEAKAEAEAGALSAPSDDEESTNLKAAIARGAAKITPTLGAWAKRAKIAAALLAARARRTPAAGADDVEIPVRRTTAPAPGGGLHTAGRKVVRGTLEDHFEEETREADKPRFKITKKKAAIAGTVGLATVLVAFALHKPAAAPPLASAPPVDPAAANAEAAPAPAPIAPADAKPIPPPADPLAAAAAAMAASPGKPGKAVPFTNGPVGAHPTTIRVKMDGPIESIQGAAQPTGFTVVTPNRKSLDPGAALADKDARLAGIHVANEAGGAEFTVTFRDGVPNYLVRAKGETLELVLARPASRGDKAPEAHAKKRGKGKKR